MFITDINGATVTVGTVIKVLHIHPSVIETLENEEKSRVLSMLGEQFEVYEVDEYGRAWVEKWWHEGQDYSQSHSLALESKEMEVISIERHGE